MYIFFRVLLKIAVLTKVNGIWILQQLEAQQQNGAEYQNFKILFPIFKAEWVRDQASPFTYRKQLIHLLDDRGLSTLEMPPVIEWTVGPLAYQTVIYRQIAPQIV